MLDQDYIVEAQVLEDRGSPMTSEIHRKKKEKKGNLCAPVRKRPGGS